MCILFINQRQAANVLVPFNLNASIGSSVLGALMLFKNMTLFEYLLRKGMDANGIGCIFQKSIYSLCQTAIALEVQLEYLNALLAHGATLDITRTSFLPQNSVENRVMLRQFERISKGSVVTQFQAQAQQSNSQLASFFDVFAKERHRTNSLIKMVIYCNQSSKLARALVPKMTDTDMGQLSYTELLLLLAILNKSQEVMTRFIPSSNATTLAICSSEAAANLLMASIDSPDQYTGRVSHLFFPVFASKLDSDLYIDSYKKIERALVPHLVPHDTQFQIETSRTLRSLVDTHSQKRPVLAYVALTATISYKILSYDGTACFFHGLAKIFDALYNIASRPEIGATLVHLNIFQQYAGFMRDLYHQGETIPAANQFRFYQAPATNTSLESTSYVEEIPDGLEL